MCAKNESEVEESTEAQKDGRELVMSTYRNGRLELPPRFKRKSEVYPDSDRDPTWDDWYSVESRKEGCKKALKQEHKEYGEKASHYGKDRPKTVSYQHDGEQYIVKCPLCMED